MNQGINVVLQMAAFNSSGSQSDTVISKPAKPLRFMFDRFFFLIRGQSFTGKTALERLQMKNIQIKADGEKINFCCL